MFFQLEEAYARLLKADDDDMADDHVAVWEPLEFSLTVARLLESI